MTFQPLTLQNSTQMFHCTLIWTLWRPFKYLSIVIFKKLQAFLCSMFWIIILLELDWDPRRISRADYFKFLFKISQYTSASILSSMNSILPTPFQAIELHIMTFPPPYLTDDYRKLQIWKFMIFWIRAIYKMVIKLIKFTH